MSVATVAMLLADQQPKGPEFGKASPWGLLIILVLLVGTVLLIRSMNSQLRRLPKSFDGEHPEPDQEFDEGTDSGAAGTATADDAGTGTARDAPETTESPTDGTGPGPDRSNAPGS